ncbi:ATP-dependent helicase [Actinacidiphila yeochonensis]|uniref:ATP-dependent helicase n=1 Tax=Actinacidiphila yeochonensis TaxID=89050 RepID=UPI000565AE3C|nr:ATP-dependent DNA helicase [Actinacidiphila yeochonensis]
MRTPAGNGAPPVLDARQRAVVEHASGPLLVLGGPGTGKTTTLVEAVAARVRAGTSVDRLLVLTHGRTAAEELRDRIAARLDDAGPGAAGLYAGPGTAGPGTAERGVTESGTAPQPGERRAGRAPLSSPQANTFHSFCYALLRAHQEADLFAEPVRLLSGPEQDLMVRELLAGQSLLAREGRGRVRWPDDLRAALTTRGFADEVRAVIARTRELGLAPAALAAFARRNGRRDWEAAADFLQEYLDVADLQGVIDYTELVHRAVRLAERPEVHADLTARYDAVFVDEFQDTDPAQVRLLRALAGQGRTLVVFGDPDQSVYAFRGADVNGILDFPARFPAADGSPAPVHVLTGGRRSAAALLTAGRQLASRLPLPRVPAAAARLHRQSTPARPGGTVDVRTYPSPGAEVEAVADALRRAHLEDHLPWSAMAVLTRTTSALPGLRRALTAAGVPVELPAGDTPLHAEPAVAPLLLALRLAAQSAVAAAETSALGGLGLQLQSDAGAPGVLGVLGGEAATGALGSEVAPRDLGRGIEPGVLGGQAGTLLGRGPASGVPGDGSVPGLPGGEAATGVSGGDADLGLLGDPSEAEPPDGAANGAEPLDGAADGSEPLDGAVDGAAGGRTGAGAPGSQAGAEEGPAPRRTPGERPVALTVDDALTLLTSPLGGMDSGDLRRLGRALREEERAAGRTVPRPSDELIAEAVADPARLTAHDPAYARGARRVGTLLRAARAVLAGGGTAEDALWKLWDGTTWPGRLERAALRGGPAGRNADRDLDAVCALFETAARAEERTGGRGALNLIEELSGFDVVADTLGGAVVRPEAVRLTTAHRAKGQEWRLVAVTGVQDGVWPDLRRRGSLLEADRIGRDGLAPPLSQGALLTEERRLFYVAATRARDRLLVTAVKSAADDGEQPSRFLAELGVQPQHVPHRPRRPLAVPALVAELRATTVDPEASPALREAAAARLAALAALHDEGHPLVPTAHPGRWWGLYEPTRSEVPVRDRDRPVVLSGSALDQLANTCALQWFLGREVRAEPPATAAQGFGNVVHVLADEVASGRAPADLDVLMARLDTVWDGLAFDAPWKSRQEKENARAALERFLRWHVLERGREPVAGEHAFDVTLEAGGATVRVRGSLDRVETDAEGHAYVVDFKTGRSKPTAQEVAHHPQLAVYQLAVREGAVDELFGGTRPHPGGAELVQLRVGASRREGGEALPAVQRQEPLAGEAGEWAGELLAEAAGRVLDERFTPSAGHHCAHCAFRSACSARAEGRQVVE